MVVNMGYRSDVAISMFKSDFYNMLEDAKINCPDAYNLLQNADSIREYDRKPEKVIVINWSWVKWYPEYTDVEYLKNYLMYLVDNNKPYKFVRIGEEIEDIETDGDYCDWEKDGVVLDAIYPVTYISCDEDGELVNIK